MRVLLRLLLTAVLFTAVGCSAPSGEQARVRDTVSAYNEALVHAFEAMDMNAMNQVATEEQATREFYLMAALGEGRVWMDATLVSLEFGDVTFPEDGRALVTTTEVWDYDHISLDTSETVRSEHGVTYHLEYELVLTDGRWLVDRVTSLDEPPASEDATASEEATP